MTGGKPMTSKPPEHIEICQLTEEEKEKLN